MYRWNEKFQMLNCDKERAYNKIMSWSIHEAKKMYI